MQRRKIHNNHLTHAAFCLTAAASLALSACGGDDDPTTSGQADASTTDDASTTPDASTTSTIAHQYLVMGSISADKTKTTFFAPVNSIDKDASTTVDLSKALSVNGSVRVGVDPKHNGTFYVGTLTSPVLTKYKVSTSGSFTKVAEMSFAPQGITQLDGTRNPFQFVSDTKAYYIDTRAAKVVVWNPTDMTITKSIPINGLESGVDGVSMSDEGGNKVHQVGDRFIFSVRYLVYVENSATGAAALTRAIILDSTDDSIKVVEETECGHIAFSATNTNGDVYFGSHSVQALWYAAGLGGDQITAPCMVRIKKGADDFDPDYLVKLNDITGRPTGALLQGANDLGYVMVLNQESTDSLTADNAVNMRKLAVWQMHSIELNDSSTPKITPVSLDQIGYGNGYGGAFSTTVGDDTVATPFIARSASDRGSGTFYDITDPTNFVEMMTLTGGAPSNIYQVR